MTSSTKEQINVIMNSIKETLNNVVILHKSIFLIPKYSRHCSTVVFKQSIVELIDDTQWVFLGLFFAAMAAVSYFVPYFWIVFALLIYVYVLAIFSILWCKFPRHKRKMITSTYHVVLNDGRIVKWNFSIPRYNCGYYNDENSFSVIKYVEGRNSKVKRITWREEDNEEYSFYVRRLHV